MTALPALAADVLVSGKPIITFDQKHGLLPDRVEPLLSIYANGTAVAVFPAYMKKAGRHSYQLSQDELQTLKTLISKAGIKQFNQQLIHDLIEENQEVEIPKAKLASISDSTVTVVKINVDQGSAETLNSVNGDTIEPLSQAITFENVADAAINNPDIQPLNDLQVLESQLKTILGKTGR